MRKNIQSIMKALLMFSLLTISIPTEASGPLRVKLDFNLGAKGNNCSGKGICLIYNPDDRFPGEYSLMSIQNNLFVIEIPFSKRKENPDAFNGEYFTMEEEYIIPFEFCKELGFDYELILPKGRHKLVESLEGFRVEFKMD